VPEGHGEADGADLKGVVNDFYIGDAVGGMFVIAGVVGQGVGGGGVF